MGSNDNRSPSVQPCQPELRIAMDGRNLIRPLSGIGRSIESAVLALSDIVSELHLLAPGPLHGDFQSLTYLDRVTIHCDRFPTAIGRSLWGSSALPRRVSSIEPDIFWAPAHRLSRAISKSFPTVLTVHDLAWKFAPDTMLPHRRIGDRLLTKSSVANATSIIVPSVRVANELKAEFPEAAFKVVNVPNIVKPRTAFESHKTMSKLGVEPPFCLFVGTIEPRKNLIRTVKAFLSLPKSVRGEVKMVIAGALGWMTRDIQRVLVSGGDDIIFLNRVSEDALSSLYKESLFLLMPSLYEGFGYPAFEAQQFGKAVLTSERSPMADNFKNNAVLVDPKDTNAIAKGMADLLARCRTGNRIYSAPKHAMQYPEQAIIKQLLTIFDQTKQLRAPRIGATF